MYSIDQDSWHDAAKLNVARFQHSSCALESKIYVFCGRTDDELLNSIEMLDTKNQQAKWWSLIESFSHLFDAIVDPAAVPISEKEIAILGGTIHVVAQGGEGASHR